MQASTTFWQQRQRFVSTLQQPGVQPVAEQAYPRRRERLKQWQQRLEKLFSRQAY